MSKVEPRLSYGNSLAERGIHLRHERTGTHRTGCPECGRLKHRAKDDALAVTIEPDGHAVWFCHRCAWTGSTADERRGRPARPRRPAPEPEPEVVEARHRAGEEATEVWQASLPITADCVAGRYLIGRGCALPHPDGDLHWHPAQHHWKTKHTGPALVALVTDPLTCKAVTIHRTWLASDGSGKAPIDRPRLYWRGLPKLGLCRLWPDAEITMGLLVAEGIETALTAARGFGHAWATLDKGNLAALPVLAGIDALTIIADPDPDGGGQRAAEACRLTWSKAGVEVIVWPGREEGQDFNDFAGSPT